MLRTTFLLLALSLSQRTLTAQEGMIYTFNGSEGYRPTSAQSAGTDRVELLFFATGVDKGERKDSPNATDLNKHTAREIRRLFPSLRYTTPETGSLNNVPGKFLRIDVLVNGSGLERQSSAVHALIKVTACDPNHREYAPCSAATITIGNDPRVINEHLKKSLTTVLEAISDGWHDPTDHQDSPNYRAVATPAP
jgi:hypothetical protein